MIRCGQILFKYRNLLFPLGLLTLLVAFRPVLAFGDIRLDTAVDALGLAVVAMGLGLRGLVIGLQYIHRGGRNHQVYASQLVTGGIFAASRNPLYVGNLLLLLGVILISGNPWSYLIGIPLALGAYRAIVAAEEAFLLDEFGDEYRRYCATVNRWLPSPRRVGRALRQTPFNWSRVIVKDYNTIYVWFSAAMAVLVYEHLSIPAYHQNWLDQRPLGLAFLALTGIYALARVLKKKRILTPDGGVRLTGSR